MLVHSSTSYSNISRASWGKRLFPIILAEHKKRPLEWKIDILLPTMNEKEFKKIMRKINSYWNKERNPAFCMIEKPKKSERYNLHIIGRGITTKKEIREILITSLVKDKRRGEERTEISKQLDMHFEAVENTETKNPDALINYTLKTSMKLVCKNELLPKGMRNYRDLGLIGKGGISKRRKDHRDWKNANESNQFGSPVYELLFGCGPNSDKPALLKLLKKMDEDLLQELKDKEILYNLNN